MAVNDGRSTRLTKMSMINHATSHFHWYFSVEKLNQPPYHASITPIVNILTNYLVTRLINHRITSHKIDKHVIALLRFDLTVFFFATFA